MKQKKVCIMGLGYIGLPTAVVLAQNNNFSVFGFDINVEVVNTINAGKLHILEPGLDIVFTEVVNAGKLRASVDIEEADIFIIVVPTPFKDDYEADLSYIKNALDILAKVLKKGDLILLESTSPVGTTFWMSEYLATIRENLKFPHRYLEDADVNIAHCPERVLPGNILYELENNDRVVGGISTICTEKAMQFYGGFVKGQCIKTDHKTAELTKLVENSFRDVNIGFANELSLICNKFGINVWELISLANRHPRVNILNPGIGVGGHCIAVDPWFIIKAAPHEAQLLKKAREVNLNKTQCCVQQILSAYDASNENVKVAFLGLSFKPNIDDLRESPAIKIVSECLSHIDSEIMVVEPHINTLPSQLAVFKNVILADINTAIEKANLIVCLVKHNVFLSYVDVIKNKKYIDYIGLI
jgi:UDP-N-acetyl-D-mannosaminuronic acid dehydrogenase